jgi:hypothetical protein
MTGAQSPTGFFVASIIHYPVSLGLGKVVELVKLKLVLILPFSLSPLLQYNMCHSDERSEEESSTNIHQPVSSELVELVEVVDWFIG